MDWKQIDTAPEGQAVMTKIDDHNGVRNEQVMHRDGRLWYAGDMYVYYKPTHWRPLTEIERLEIKNQAEHEAIEKLKRVNASLGLQA